MNLMTTCLLHEEVTQKSLGTSHEEALIFLRTTADRQTNGTVINRYPNSGHG